MVEKDVAKAAEIYQEAVENNYAPASFALGKLMKNGELGEVNEAKAFGLIKSAAEAGLPRAQNETGANYFAGYGVSKDYAQAYFWFDLAARQGDAFAQLNLAVAYAKGIGVKVDPEQTLKWLLVSQSVKDSEKKLKQIKELRLTLSWEAISRATEDANRCIETNYREC